MKMEIENKNGLTLPRWSTFNLATYLDDLRAANELGLEIANKIAAIPNPTFKDVILPFTVHSQEFGLTTSALFHLKDVVADKYPGIEEIAEEASVIMSRYSDEIGFHKGLFDAYVKVQNSDEFKNLSLEEKHIINEAIKGFKLRGIDLPVEKQERLKVLNEREAELQTKFSANSLAATEAWTLHIEDEKELSGLSADNLAMLRNLAKDKNLPGYLITLKPGPYFAIQELANNRELRKKTWLANATRASEIGTNPENDNTNIIVELISIRNETAKILGFNNYAELSIESKMAKDSGVLGVDIFFQTLKEKTLPKSKEDLYVLSNYATGELAIDTIEPWDLTYVSHKYKNEYYSVDNEKLRDYFPVSKVKAGFFATIERLFDCKITKHTGVDVWHPSVEFYEVSDLNGKVFAGFYMDLFERTGKRSGAWMNDLSPRLNAFGIQNLPTAYIVTNFRDIGDNENYLSHDEITTLFHEGGHNFHQLFTQANYIETGMMSVEWDAVELPSQLLEEWAWKYEVLQSISSHKETGEPLPRGMFDKMIAAKNYNAGVFNGRQVGLGLFDWSIHKLENVTKDEIFELYKAAMNESIAVEIKEAQRNPQTFGHIFSGGYSAGYYSYNWANGLVADVWAAFEEAGEDREKEVATRYKNEILAYGAMRPMSESFRAFRGRDPKPELLIPFLGLK